jgi:hypothetical protein
VQAIPSLNRRRRVRREVADVEHRPFPSPLVPFELMPGLRLIDRRQRDMSQEVHNNTGERMPRHFIVLASLLLLATIAGTSSAWANWGCTARNNSGHWGNSFGFSTKAEAGEAAIRTCASSECIIIACSPNVNTRAEERALWPLPSTPTKCEGAAC